MVQIFFIFTPKIGEIIQFDSYFSGLKPPTRYIFILTSYLNHRFLSSAANCCCAKKASLPRGQLAGEANVVPGSNWDELVGMNRDVVNQWSLNYQFLFGGSNSNNTHLW